MSYFTTPMDAATPHAQLHMYRLLEHSGDGLGLHYTPRHSGRVSPASWKTHNGSRGTREYSGSQDRSLPYNSARRRTDGSIVSITRNAADNTFLSGEVVAAEENMTSTNDVAAPRLFDIVAEDQVMNDGHVSPQNGHANTMKSNGLHNNNSLNNNKKNGAAVVVKSNTNNVSVSSTSPADSALVVAAATVTVKEANHNHNSIGAEMWQAEAERLQGLVQSYEQQISLVMEEGAKSTTMSPMRALAKLIRAMLRQREGGKRHKLERDEARARQTLSEHLYNLQGLALSMQEHHQDNNKEEGEKASHAVSAAAPSAAADNIYAARNKVMHGESEDRRRITYDEADAFYDLLQSADAAAMALVMYERHRLSSVALSRPTISPSALRAWSQENSYVSKERNTDKEEEGVLHDVNAFTMPPE